MKSDPGTGKTFMNLQLCRKLKDIGCTPIYVVRNSALTEAVLANRDLWELETLKIITYAQLPAVMEKQDSSKTWYICDEWYDAIRKEPLTTDPEAKRMLGVHGLFSEQF